MEYLLLILQKQTRHLIDSLSSRNLSEEVLDVCDDLESKRYEFRVKDEWKNHCMAVDAQAFRGPWLTLDNEKVLFLKTPSTSEHCFLRSLLT
eukprot:UN02053